MTPSNLLSAALAFLLFCLGLAALRFSSSPNITFTLKLDLPMKAKPEIEKPQIRKNDHSTHP